MQTVLQKAWLVRSAGVLVVVNSHGDTAAHLSADSALVLLYTPAQLRMQSVSTALIDLRYVRACDCGDAGVVGALRHLLEAASCVVEDVSLQGAQGSDELLDVDVTSDVSGRPNATRQLDFHRRSCVVFTSGRCPPGYC
jgi:hypothetical protein